ncbi:MAG: VanW family protein [Microgenomates group bacterium]
MIPNKQGGVVVQILVVVLLVISIVSALFLYSLQLQKKFESRLFPHISINGKDVGGMNKTEVYILFAETSSKIQKTTLALQFKNMPVATLSATLTNTRPDIDTAFDQAYIVGRSSHVPSRILQTLISTTGIQIYKFPLKVTYSKQPIQEALTHLIDQYESPPINAKFQFENGKVTVFEHEENGLHIETGKALQMIDEYIQSLINKPLSKTIAVQSTVVKPTVTLSQTNTYGIEELIAEGVSDYTHSIPQRIHNLLLGTSKFNGVLIPKGATFSFNETVGDISSSTGYQPAYIIKDGKTVLGDGGGICQVSTTLFRAVLNAGLPIVEHHSHAYRVGYYENDAKPGLDATVFGPTVDFKFVNNTPASILIQTSADEENNKLSFKFYGKKDKRTIELSTPIISDNTSAPEPQFQDDPTLKKGVVRQVDFAAPGARSRYSYKVTLGKEVLFQKDFNVWFRPWRAVFLVGTAD